MKNSVMTFMIDLFCGAGGTTLAVVESNTNIKVVYCINHDANAIRSHAEANPECKHATEDIRTFDLSDLIRVIADLRKRFPGCKIALWASLECTNYSKAKGGQPRDADSRSLADHLQRYIEAIDPDFLWIENVREFMSWGPLDKKGKPISSEKGKDYLRWIKEIKSQGYYFKYDILNSADYNGLTIRTRYFAQFSKDKELISFPEPTNSKNPEKGDLFGVKKKWRGVKEVLDLEDEGVSVFQRKKDLCERTYERIFDGCIKIVAGGEENFLKTYYGNSGQTNLDYPCPTLTTKDRVAKVHVKFLTHYYSGGGQVSELNQPHPAIMTVPKAALTSIVPWILNPNFNNVGNDINNPCPTVLASRKHYSIVTPCIINKNSSTAPVRSIDDPCPTITQRTHYLMNPQWNDRGRGLDDPCFTLIARMDKAPPYLVSIDMNVKSIFSFEKHSPMKFKLRVFMHVYGISDIKMRMLKIPELLQIQGFPKDYKLVGTKTEQKKYIGNSVEVNVGKALFQAIDEAIQNKVAC